MVRRLPHCWLRRCPTLAAGGLGDWVIRSAQAPVSERLSHLGPECYKHTQRLISREREFETWHKSGESQMSTYLFELTRGARAVRAALAVVALAATALPQAQAAGVSGQGTWETTLQGRDLDGNTANGFEAYYDTALNITWLADANYAKTSGYDADGLLTWDQAEAWVASLNVNGIAGWRLPTTVDTGAPGCDNEHALGGTDCGYNVDTSTSEMAHMFYVTLGNKALVDTAGNYQNGNGPSNTGPFENGPFGIYWSGKVVAPNRNCVGNCAWLFGFNVGNQGYSSKASEYYAWAVRPGDVAAVPEPQTYALLLAGVAALMAARKQRQA